MFMFSSRLEIAVKTKMFAFLLEWTDDGRVLCASYVSTLYSLVWTRSLVLGNSCYTIASEQSHVAHDHFTALISSILRRQSSSSVLKCYSRVQEDWD
jgi:hypothetical protein